MTLERLLVIDGHALAFRAFHAMRDANLRTAEGEATFAVFGFFRVLLASIQEYRPHYVAVAFDVGRTFRDDLYAEYKAGRAETPAEFHSQLARIQEVLHALNIPIYTADGYEADDVIGTLARQATAQHVETLILTGDTDTLQLVNGQVHVLLANPYSRSAGMTRYDPAAVRERYYGLRPDQLADLRGLKGDASDNIPGVKGIGEKGAISLLNEFGSIEQIYQQLEAVPSRYRKHLEGQQAQAEFSRQLAVIVCDAPVTLDLPAARVDEYDRTAVIELFQQLQFGKTLIDKLPTPIPDAPSAALPTASAAAVLPVPPAACDTQQLALFALPDAPAVPIPPPTSGDYRTVSTPADLDALLHALNSAPAFAFDVESTGLSPLTDTLVGIALSTQAGTGWYIPVSHRTGEQLPRDTLVAALRPYFANPQQAKYAHNAKFDIELLQQVGVPVHGLAFDVLLAARLLGRQQAGLKDLAFYELHLSEPMQEIAALIGKGSQQIGFDQVAIEHATPYAAADADMTLRLTAHFREQLALEPSLQAIFAELELPLVSVLVAMETAGILVDQGYLQQLHERLGARLHELEQEIYGHAGGRFNINSGIQLNEVLFDKIGLPTTGLKKLRASDRFSLTADVLETMADLHPIIAAILKYRQLAKLKSTYVDALPELINPNTGRIHTTYNQIGTATGRISSNHPNMQNIPVRTDEGGEIRRAFVAPPDHVLLAADYSQIELRVLAHITRDPGLVQVFQAGHDIHAATAAQLFGVAQEDVTKNQRRIAKTVVFGVIYGISAFGLAQRIGGLDRSSAQELIDALFANFPGIRTYIDETLERGRRDGYVQSLFGRRRLMPELHSSGPRKAAAEREAINAPIQATAADLMKLAMLKVAAALRERQLQSRMLLQVHDELILEVPHAEIAEVGTMVREVMESAYQLSVPLQVGVEVGPNWEEMQPFVPELEARSHEPNEEQQV